MKYLLAAVLIFSPLAVGAQNSNLQLNQIPQPIQDLFHTFSQIHINAGQNQAVEQATQGIQNTISQVAANPQNLLSQVRYWWGNLNSWLQNHLGISFKEILTVIGNLFIWVFELMIKLIRLALPNIQ